MMVRLKRRRTSEGYNLPEFCATFAAFMLLIMPLAYGLVVFFRFSLANNLVTSMVHRAALAEKRSLSLYVLSQDPCIAFAQKCGIEFGQGNVSLICINKSGASLTVRDGSRIPKDWLPGGKCSPCTYLLQINQPATINALVTSDNGVPGITAPLKVNLSATSNWENLGCDPSTKDFFINE